MMRRRDEKLLKAVMSAAEQCPSPERSCGVAKGTGRPAAMDNLGLTRRVGHDDLGGSRCLCRHMLRATRPAMRGAARRTGGGNMHARRKAARRVRPVQYGQIAPSQDPFGHSRAPIAGVQFDFALQEQL
ncbi:hypothetical protein L1887_56901 [Cichorium endivia]|nr:hypothetical protein L1887_56901 [Cichorium endivia]